MTTAQQTKPRGEFDWLGDIPDFGEEDTGAWDTPLLYPLYTGITCRVCHCPVLIDLGLEPKPRKPKSVPKRRTWYSCPLCGRGTVRPDVTGELRQIGEIDTWSFKLRKMEVKV